MLPTRGHGYACLVGLLVNKMAEVDAMWAEAIGWAFQDDAKAFDRAWALSGGQLVKEAEKAAVAAPVLGPFISEYQALYEARNHLVHGSGGMTLRTADGEWQHQIVKPKRRETHEHVGPYSEMVFSDQELLDLVGRASALWGALDRLVAQAASGA
jgi:hypothetical protein